jgi:hypothetical protein
MWIRGTVHTEYKSHSPVRVMIEHVIRVVGHEPVERSIQLDEVRCNGDVSAFKAGARGSDKVSAQAAGLASFAQSAHGPLALSEPMRR